MLYKNILLIDDDPEDADIFREAMASLNKDFVLRCIYNPKKALEELKVTEKLPDLIFLDYNMPIINGLELLRELKKESRLEHIPVILISTPSEEFMQEEMRNNRIIKYISKPDSYTELIDILDSIL